MGHHIVDGWPDTATPQAPGSAQDRHGPLSRLHCSGPPLPGYRTATQQERACPVKEVLIFIHIPKTAGTTFSAILDRNYKKSRIVSIYPNLGMTASDFRRLPERLTERMECVRGHFDYGLHKSIQRPFTYMTFLRHPAEHLRSRYNHMRTSRFHSLHYLAKQGMSLGEFARMPPDNFQTRTLAGIEMIPGKPHPRLSQEHLDLARENLEKHFCEVGITERFDESLILIKKRLGLERIHYVRRNVRRRLERAEPLKSPTRQAMEENSRLDLALYDWAVARLDGAIESKKEAFEKELSAFKKANAIYSRTMWPLDKLSHRLTKATWLLRYLHKKSKGTP